MEEVTRRFVRQLVDTNDFPSKTVEATKKAIIDTVGCMIAGVRSPIGQAAIDVFGGFGGRPEATVIGDGRKLPTPICAYITGQCCVGPDLSDNYKPGTIIISHPGEGIVPAVFALAEKIDASLEQIFAATIIGYETAGRYAQAIEPRRPEVYSFSTHYTLAAATACARLLGFDERQTVNTLGIAGTLAPLPVTMAMWGFREHQRPASWHRDMPGQACFAGISAALFAQTPFKATHRLLEDETAFYKIAGSENYDPQRLFEDWGRSFIIDAITYKQIPSCYFNQPCVEAVRLLLAENDIRVDEIGKIDLYAPTMLAKNFCHYPPTTSVDTASSVKYLTTMYLLTADPGPDWYLDFQRHLESEAYRHIADKIEVHLDETLQRQLKEEGRLIAKAAIEVGPRRLEKAVSFVKGSPEDPFSMEEIQAKFMKLCEPVIGAGRAERFLSTIDDYPTDKRTSALVDELHNDYPPAGRQPRQRPHRNRRRPARPCPAKAITA